MQFKRLLNLENIVNSLNFLKDKTIKIVKGAYNHVKNNFKEYALITTFVLGPKIMALAGTWEDDFSDNIIGDKWSILADPLPSMEESGGKLRLAGSSGNDWIETADTSYSGNQTLEVRFDAVSPENMSNYKIQLVNGSVTDKMEIRIRGPTNLYQVEDENGFLGSLPVNFSEYFTFKLERSVDTVTASVSEDGGFYQLMNFGTGTSTMLSTTLTYADIAAGFNGPENFYVQNFLWYGANIPDIVNGHESPPTVSFDSDASEGLESVLTPQIPVTFSKSLETTPATIDYQVIIGGTAELGTDYTLTTPGTLTLETGATELTKYITPTIINDTDVEPNETIIIELLNPNKAKLNSPTQHTYTILNDDLPAVNDWILY